MIKKKLFKYGSVFMCAALMACSFAACGTNTSSAVQNEVAANEQDTDTETMIADVLTSQLSSAPKVATEAKTDSKEETVFVFTKADGQQDHVIVNEKLKNVTGKSSITDVSSLSNITNLTGDETSTTNGNSLTWAADGNSITYQGTTTQTAPVSMKVTYYLDGKEISASDLAGKSGKVTMRFDYTNNAKKTITVNGKTKTVYVPFTMVTGMLLPSHNFSNIEVTNGKITEVNDSNVVFGITMPGLKDSLDMKFDNEKLDLDVPEYFEVTADVTDFELDMMMSMATSNFLSDIDTDDLSIDNLKDKVNELQDAADQLTDGTNQLADATPQLVDGSKALADGTQQLNDQVPTLTDGVSQLDNGAGQLSDGLSTVVSSMPTLTSGISQLYDGSGKLFDGAKTLNDGVNQLKAGTSQLADETNGLPALQAGISQYTEGVASAADGSDALASGSAQVADGLAQLQAQLSGENGLMDGMVKLADGSAQVSNGLAQLSDGLTASISEYESNKTKLKTSAQALEAAGTQLNGTLSALGNDNLLIQPATDMYSESGLTTAAQTALANKYMDAYSFVTANASNPVVTALNAGIAANAQLQAAGITDLASIYKNEMVILVNTAANESAGKVENTVNSSVAQLAAGAAQVNAGLQSAVAKKDTLETALGQLVAGSSSVSSGSAQLNSGLSQLKSNNDTLNGGIANAVSGAKQLDAGASQLTAASGVPALVSGTSDLKNGIGQLSESSPALVTGINALDDGAKQLKIGTAQLLQGAGALASGVTQLNDGAHELSDGAEQLNDGVVELNNGMIQFNEEGISQITSLVGSDADDAIDTIKKVINLGKDYQSFAGKADDMDGSVTFIYKTEGVTK